MTAPEKTEQGSAKGPSADATGIAPPTSRSSPAGRSPLMTQVSRRAMATEFVVLLPPHAVEHVETVVDALELLDEIEHKLTIYRDESEVSMLNRAGADRRVRLSPLTFDLLRRAVLWSERTDGAFDVTAGPLIEAWGFTRRQGRKPSRAEIAKAIDVVGYRHVELSLEDRSARFAKPGMSVNLGAIGKGAALDRLADHLRDRGVHDFLIHGGNSSVIARGDQTLDQGRGWAVGIAHPTKPKRRLTGLWLQNAALATSGSGKQFFHHQGRRFGHVIDPRTGYPVGDLLSLTVVMPSAADADAAATGLFVAGSAAIETMKADPRHTEWFPSMVLVFPGRRQEEVELRWHGDLSRVEETS